jgi:penicillin-binding protein 1A
MPYRGFDRVYPLALGTCSVRPVELARAFAVFANQGREVTPIAIRFVEDRNGKVIFNPERDVNDARLEKQKKAGGIQVITPQTAYIMTSILQNSVRMGTLASSTNYGSLFRYTDANGKSYTMPAAGKTGTTQNWTNAWAVGYTPHITSAVWFGFDKPGETLGLSLTGATLSGRAWARFMKAANEDYPHKDFAAPQSGLVRAEVCSVSGMLPTPACGNNRTMQYFLDGTQPVTLCTTHTNAIALEAIVRERLESEYYQTGAKQFDLADTAPLMLDLSFLNEDSDEDRQTPQENSSGTPPSERQPALNQNAARKEDDDAPAGNRFLD